MQWKTSAKIVAQVRKPLSSVAVCCALCLGTSLALAGEELWTFDTQAELEDWDFKEHSEHGVVWDVDDQEGVLFVTGDPRPDIGVPVFGEPAMLGLVGNDNWTDYTIEQKVRIDDGNWGGGLVFRAQSEQDYYGYYMNVQTNQYELWRYESGPSPDETYRSGIWPFLSGVNVTYARNEWYDIKVDITGSQSTLWVNGELQGQRNLDIERSDPLTGEPIPTELYKAVAED